MPKHRYLYCGRAGVYTSEYLYLYKIESLNFDTNVLIERKCEALHMTCLRIQHEVESDMG